MTADIPRPLEVQVQETLPGFYSVGWNTYNTEIQDICSSGNLSPPSGEDAGYSCPSAGTYNFHFVYNMFGDRNAWVRLT